MVQQRRPGRQPATAEQSKWRWNKGINIIVMECYIQNKPVDENGDSFWRPQTADV